MGLTTPKAIIAAAIILALSGLYLFRYEVSPGTINATAIRLNRLTGTISFCLLGGEPREYQCQ